MKNSKRIVNGMFFLAFFLLVLAGTLALRKLEEKNENTDFARNVQKGQETTREEEDGYFVTYEGKSYQYNQKIKTILFLGIDQFASVEEMAQTTTGGRSDTIILLLLNEEDKTLTMLPISRDTMTEIDIYDDYGMQYATETKQLALQYAYGDGGAFSAQLTKRAVSNLLYQLPIHNYMALNLTVLEEVVDLLGGIPITYHGDHSYLDQRMVPGETMVLDGPLAEKFVRQRDIQVVGSNAQRMQRQEEFLGAFLARVKNYVSGNLEEAWKQYESLQPYLTTDISPEDLKGLLAYEPNQDIYEIPGETVPGTYYDEFLVDEEALRALLIELLYVERTGGVE